MPDDRDVIPPARCSVRRARRDDADAIAAAHVAGWRGGYRGIFPDDYLDGEAFATERRDMWRSWGWTEHLPTAELFVGVIDEVVVGFAHAGPVRETDLGPGVGEVYGFYADPAAWGTGLADMMMAAAVGHLVEGGFERAVLWVLRDNPRARRFYERAGWTLTGRTDEWPGPQLPSYTAPPVAEVEYGRRLG